MFAQSKNIDLRGEFSDLMEEMKQKYGNKFDDEYSAFLDEVEFGKYTII